MRSAGNFHPEWGYLAPAPSFMRTARVALVATAIGATAGAVVVVSLVAHSGASDENSSIAAHALVTAAPIVSSVTVPTTSASLAGQAPNVVAQAPEPPAVHPAAELQIPAGKAEPDNLAGASKITPVAAAPTPAATPAPAKVTALAETPPADVTATASPESAVAPETTKKTEFRRRRLTTAEAMRRWQAETNARKRRDDGSFGPIFHLFSFRGPSSYDN